MNKNIIFVILAIIFFTNSKIDYSINNSSLSKVINDYRVRKGLNEIPISPSLTLVAEKHVRDLADNQPSGGKCNLHSWSDKGEWTSCCYTSDHAQAECMWNKPRELSSYRGNGYEIAAWSSNSISAEYALKIWQGSKGHHDVILNKGIWEKGKWNAIGAAIYKGYAVVWFGHELETNN